MKTTLLLSILFILLLISSVTASPDISETEIQLLKARLNAGVALSPEQKATLTAYEEQNAGPVRMDPRRDDQGGPDEFGYKWIDSNEDGGPEFEWIDIDDFDGVRRLQFGDDANSGALNLGFEFPFYDEVFESVRMCSNGWASFTSGSVRYSNNGFNLPGGDIENMLAVCFTDWYPPDGGTFLFWSDEDMAVCSWVDVPHIGNRNVHGTFQILLFPNGRIIYQYDDVDGMHNDIVIGIQDADRNIGLEVLNHEDGYMEEELSIRIGAQSGWVTGTVTALGMDEPIAEATLTLNDGTEAVTDEDGVYWLNDVSEDDYTLTASKFGFNPITSDEFFVADQETLEVNFELPHPEIDVSRGEFDIELDPNERLEEEFDIINDGNGELEFSLHLAVPAEEERDERGDIIFDWNVGELANDIDLEGVVTDGENFYVSGTNEEGDAHQVYVFNRLGELYRQFDQPVEDPGADGFRSMTTDGDYLYSADGVDITQFTFDGEYVATIPGLRRDVNPIIHITYDPDTDHFWISNIRTDIFEIDREGNVHNSVEFPESIRGMAWLENDADGHYLYVQHTVPDGPSQAVSKINPDNNDIHYVFDFDTGEGDRLYSCAITNSYNPLVWMLVTMVTNRRVERVIGIEMDLNTSWVSIDPFSGTVDPESSSTISIDFDAESWLPGQYELLLRIESNVATDPIEIPLTMMVTNAGLEPDHYEFSETDREHIIVIGTARIRGQAASFGDEIGAFTQDGRCIGAATWLNAATTLIAYGDDPETEEVDGFSDDEEFMFKVWDESTALEFDATLTVLNGDETYTVDGSTRGTLEVAGFVRDHELDLPFGWSMISTNLMLDHDEIPLLFSDMVAQGSLLLLKDDQGRFYAPLADNFINIPGWDGADGYLIKTARSGVLTFTGEMIAPDAAIDLEAGWNMIAYYPDWEMEARAAFAQLLEDDNLNIVKDGLGHFYVPEWDFSNIGNTSVGNGYMMNIDNDVEFHYPAEDPGVDAAPMVVELPLQHLTAPSATNSNMSWLIRSTGGFEDDDIAVLNSKGSVCGAARMVDNSTIGISVWGDDPTTTEVEGAVDGEALTLAYWQENGLTALSFNTLAGTPEYSTDGFIAIEIGAQNSAIPTEMYLSGTYPNPFNDRSVVKFGLAEAGDVELTVYDLNGRVVSELASGQMSAGHHSVTFNAHQLASGTYLIRLNSPAGIKISKAVLLR